ncbi:MAG: N-acetyltransferase [Acidimicrobiia bacterium]|nr:N-acetyltransferase [Acidimicrobiia bacterium]
MELRVRKVEDRSRYELMEGDTVVGIAEFTIEGDTVVFPHTVIDPDRRGEGLGAILTQGALDDVRPTGRKVVPVCWYVAKFIDTHLGYADLLA